MEKMKAGKYRLKEGQKHYLRVPNTLHDVIPMHPGETVELTSAQALAFRDKFDFVGGATAEPAVKTKRAAR